MRVDVSIEITVANPTTHEDENWTLHAVGSGSGDDWECEMMSLRRENQIEDWIDFATEYGLDGSSVDPWYEQLIAACIEAGKDAEENEEEE